MTRSSLFNFLGLALLSLCLLYWQLVFQDKALYWRDILHTYYPFQDFITRSFKAGDFPLWNPYVFTGIPQLAAIEPPLLYPGNWIFQWLDFSRAVTFGLILHHLLAALGLYLFCREQDWSWLSSSFTALAFTFSGVMVSMNNVYPLMWSCSWVPLLLWACRRVISRQGWREVSVFALFYGLQILSGHLEIVYFTSLLLLFYTLLQIRQQPGSPWRPGLLAIAGVALGIGLAMVQLLPTVEFLSHSVRQTGVGLETALQWSFHPLSLPTLFIPDILGNLFYSHNISPLFGEKEYGRSLLLLSTYMGISVWILALSAWLHWRPGQKTNLIFWSGVLVLSILLAMGTYLPLYRALYSLVPGLQFFRYPVKLLLFSSLALSLLAGQGVELLWQGQARRRSWLGLLTGLLLGILLLWVALHWRLDWFLAAMKSQILSAAGASGNADLTDWVQLIVLHIRQQVLFTGLIIFCLALSLILYFKTRPASRLFPLVLLAILFLDLIPTGLNSIWVIDRSFYAQRSEAAAKLEQVQAGDPQVRLIKASDVHVIPQQFLQQYRAIPYLAHMIFHIRSMNDNFALVYAFQNAYAHWAARPMKIDMLYGLYTQAFHLKRPELRNVIENLLAVKYIHALSSPPEVKRYLETHPQQYRRLGNYPQFDSHLWENLAWQPRAHFKYQAYVVKSEDNMLETILASRENGFDPRAHAIILENEDYRKALALVPSQAAPHKQWSPPRITLASNNAVEIQFHTNTSGYLILADYSYPGWQALDNGQPVPILKANFLQRAIRVGAGQHHIRFQYRPMSFTLGIGLSLLAGLLLLAGFPLSRRFKGSPARQTL